MPVCNSALPLKPCSLTDYHGGVTSGRALNKSAIALAFRPSEQAFPMNSMRHKLCSPIPIAGFMLSKAARTTATPINTLTHVATISEASNRRRNISPSDLSSAVLKAPGYECLPLVGDTSHCCNAHASLNVGASAKRHTLERRSAAAQIKYRIHALVRWMRLEELCDFVKKWSVAPVCGTHSPLPRQSIGRMGGQRGTRMSASRWK